MSSVSSTAHPDEPPRKRIRKGTSSCWECKRRKVRCQFGPDNAIVCVGCLSRGTSCMSQEFPADHIPPTGTQIGERLGRVEALLMNLVRKVDNLDTDQMGDSPDTIDSTPITCSPEADASNGRAPVLQLLDHVGGYRRDVAAQSNVCETSQGGTPQSSISSRLSPKHEKLRKTLVALLPTQRDVDLIGAATSAWAVLKILCTPINDLFHNQDPLSSFNLDEVCKRHPIIIARTILYLTICMQQLPTNFDTSSLSIGPNLDVVLQKYTSTVEDLVLATDEIAATIGGLECLVLLSIFHANDGNLCRAWLPSRKAINVAQMKGFHRDLKVSPKSLDPTAQIWRRMWFQMVKFDRYLAVILGLPVASKDDRLGPNDDLKNPDVDVDEIFSKQCCIIAGAIIDRNDEDSDNTFALTQQIDEKLDKLRKDVPDGFWDIPSSLDVNKPSLDYVEHSDRLMNQMWFFQLESFLHLPFMLRAATEHRYDYNKFCCLRACREIVLRYLAVREAGPIQLCCRVVDFSAFVAAVMLLLDCKDQDRALIQDVLSCFERVARNPREVVAAQSVVALKTMLAPNENRSRKTRLTIPYLGTVTVVYPGNEQHTPNQEQDNAAISPSSSLQLSEPLKTPYSPAYQGLVLPPKPYDPIHESQAYSHLGYGVGMNGAPMVSFQSTQFPSTDLVPPIMDSGWNEGDSFLFDSLLNTDLSNNWLS